MGLYARPAKFDSSALSILTCERRRISGCHLIPPKNNVCEPEPGNYFCAVMTFASPWPIRFHDIMKLKCSSQRIPCAVVLGLFELNCDWLSIPMSQKSFSGLGSQTLFFGGAGWQLEICLRSQATCISICVYSVQGIQLLRRGVGDTMKTDSMCQVLRLRDIIFNYIYVKHKLIKN